MPVRILDFGMRIEERSGEEVLEPPPSPAATPPLRGRSQGEPSPCPSLWEGLKQRPLCRLRRHLPSRGLGRGPIREGEESVGG